MIVTEVGPRQKSDAVERLYADTLKTEAKHELIYILGWQGGARHVVVSTFKLVPENQGVGASIQLVLVKTKRL